MKHRVTVIQIVSFQPADGPAVALDHRFNRHLAADEQAWLRPLAKVGEAPEPLDSGWVKDPGLVVVKHEAPRRQVIPTPAERADDEARVLEIGGNDGSRFDPWFLLAPGETIQFRPAPGWPLLIRCRRGESRYTIMAVPK